MKELSIFDMIFEKDGFDEIEIIQFIVDNPACLYEDFKGIPVYCYAVSMGVARLEAVHKGYLEVRRALADYQEKIQNNERIDDKYRQLLHLYTDKQPYEMSEKNSGYTALHVAVEDGLLDAVEYLITVVGCDVNAANSNYDTPLHLACKEGEPKIMDILIRIGGAKVDVVNKTGETPLYICVERNDVKACEVLLKRGAMMNRTLELRGRGRFIVTTTVMNYVKHNGDKDMRLLFDKYALLNDSAKERMKRATIVRMQKNNSFKRIRREYRDLCQLLEDDTNIALVEEFAKRFNINVNGEYTKNGEDTKKELCRLISARMMLYARTPALKHKF